MCACVCVCVCVRVCVCVPGRALTPRCASRYAHAQFLRGYDASERVYTGYVSPATWLPAILHDAYGDRIKDADPNVATSDPFVAGGWLFPAPIEVASKWEHEWAAVACDGL